LLQIREDTELLPEMFREEAKARKKLDQEFKDAQDKMVKAAKEDASLRK